MTEQHWYSGQLRFLSISSAEGKLSTENAVYIVHAANFEEAFPKLLAVGHNYERSYKNGFGHEIRIRFIEVVTIDRLQDKSGSLDGVEVWCETIESEDSSITFDTPFDPTKSEPGHTGV